MAVVNNNRPLAAVQWRWSAAAVAEGPDSRLPEKEH